MVAIVSMVSIRDCGCNKQKSLGLGSNALLDSNSAELKIPVATLNLKCNRCGGARVAKGAGLKMCLKYVKGKPDDRRHPVA